MSDQVSILKEFKKIAATIGAVWKVFDSFCALVKNGVTMRVRWSIDGISGVFVTFALEKGSAEYGLCYLVEFWGGSSDEIALAYSDDLESNLRVIAKYSDAIFEKLPGDFSKFEAFTLQRIEENRKNLPPVPTIEDGGIVKRGWSEPPTSSERRNRA